MQVLVIDVGGSRVKILATGQETLRRFDSGPTLTPQEMVAGVLKAAAGWTYEVVAIGFPGPIRNHKLIAEPVNLGSGWLGFDFEAAFGCPVKLINDAAMQALGSYEGGKMLFLGLGTGLGSTMIINGQIAPMELGHLPYRKSTFENYVGAEGFKRLGPEKWERRVTNVIARLYAALQPDYILLGGGNTKLLSKLPPHCRPGSNANAFLGGFRLWETPAEQTEHHWDRPVEDSPCVTAHPAVAQVT